MSIPEEKLAIFKSKSSVLKKQYSLIAITPLFMHGWQETIKVQGKSRNITHFAETRVPSVKGVIRYWWRALQFELDVKKLLSKDKELFGGAGGNDENKRSPLILNFPEPVTAKNKELLCPHNDKKNISSPAIMDQIVLKLELMVCKKDKDLIKEYDALIRIIFALSGFGQRSRRGAGSLQITPVWQNVNIFVNELKNYLAIIHRSEYFDWQGEKGKIISLKSVEEKHDYRHPCLSAVWLGNAYPDAETARKVISMAGKKANNPAGVQLLGTTKSKRQASPLHATVKRIGNDYFPVVSEVAPYAIISNNSYQKARDNFLDFIGGLS